MCPKRTIQKANQKREEYLSWRTDCPCPSTQVVTLQLSNGWTIFGELSLVSDRGIYYNLVGHHDFDHGGLGHIVGMIRTGPAVDWALMSFTYNPLRESRCIPACRDPYVMGGWLTYDPVEGWTGEYSMFRGGSFVEAGEWELVGFSNE